MIDQHVAEAKRLLSEKKPSDQKYFSNFFHFIGFQITDFFENNIHFSNQIIDSF